MITSLGNHYPGLPHVHLHFIYKSHKYYLPAKEYDSRQHHVQQIAFYDETAYSGEGAITHVADVVGFETRPLLEVCPRSREVAIRNDPQYVFSLRGVRPLNRPIRNSTQRGARVTMPHVRWSSALGLVRADNLHEATLETEAEWDLLERLDASGVSVHIQTEAEGDLTVSSFMRRFSWAGPTNPNGRSWFAVGCHRARFANASGFVLDDGIREYPFARPEEALRFLEASAARSSPP